MSDVISWIANSGLKIFLVVVGAVILQKIARIITRIVVSRSLKFDHNSNARDRELREETIVRVFGSVASVLIWITVVIVAVLILGVNLAPLIAGAGFVGLAVSFSAQDLIKNFLAGFFIVLENQYRVGDVVKLDDTRGTVENITLRVTSLRDLSGNIHHIQNGNINVVTNKTMDFSKINMDIGIGYDSDIDHVEKTVNSVGESLARDSEWNDKIIEPPKFLRIISFGDSAVNIKIIGKTAPEKQWAVAGELRKRLKKTFEKEKIEIPFSQIVVHKK